MGRMIDADKAISDYAHYGISHPYDAYDLEDILTECPTVEAIPKPDYEARLKADMVAMLYKLKSEIDNMPKYYPYADHRRWYIDGDVFGLIQQKIDKLKGNEDGNK